MGTSTSSVAEQIDLPGQALLCALLTIGAPDAYHATSHLLPGFHELGNHGKAEAAYLIDTCMFDCHHVPCRILVSSTRKPISYINLAKRFLQEHGEVQLSALGIAVAPMVTVAEILKNRRLAVERKISTSLEVLSDDYRYALV